MKWTVCVTLDGKTHEAIVEKMSDYYLVGLNLHCFRTLWSVKQLPAY